MKRLSYILLALAVLGTRPVLPQSVELIIANTTMITGPSMQFELWMITSGGLALGSANLFVSYNTEAFGSNVTATFTPANFSTPLYQPINVKDYNSHTKSINIELNTPGSGTVIGTTLNGTQIGTFVFSNIADASKPTGIQFDLSHPGQIFADDEETIIASTAGYNDAAIASLVPRVEVLIINSRMLAGAQFQFDVWIKTAGVFALGSANFGIAYNPLAFGQSTSAQFTPENFSGTNYQPINVTNYNGSIKSINIELNNSGTGIPIGTTSSGTKVGTFVFTNIVDAAQVNGIHVDLAHCCVYGDDETTVLTAIAGINDASEVPLPVEITSFTAAAKARSVLLSWKTATETNNAGFEVQRRQSGGEWAKIGFVEGSGSSATERVYSMKDVVADAARYSYRLKQIDRNNVHVYSSTIEVTTTLASEDYALGANYPNPFNPSTKFTFAVRSDEKVAVKVFNTLGQEVAALFDGTAIANKLYEMNFSGIGLASGPYFYMLKTQDRCEIKKMILLK